MLIANQQFDVFSIAELIEIKTALTYLKDNTTTGHGYTNGFEPISPIYPFIKQKVLSKCESIVGREIKLTHGMLLRAQVPWNIHTDYVKGDQNPDLAFLIPLNTEPANTHTIIFDQECTDKFENFITTHTKLNHNATEYHELMLSHEPLEHLKYVSVKKICAWVPGSVFYWDRKLLHSSDNFLKNKLSEKHALVLFTQKP